MVSQVPEKIVPDFGDDSISASFQIPNGVSVSPDSNSSSVDTHAPNLTFFFTSHNLSSVTPS